MIYCLRGESRALSGWQRVELWDLSCLRNDMWSAKEILVVKVVRAHSRYRRTVHGKDVMSGLFVVVVRLEFLVFGMIEMDLFFD